MIQGRISSLAGKSIQLGQGRAVSLKTMSDTVFKPLDMYTENINRMAVPGKIILEKPVMLDEAIEFDDSFVLRKSTTINVLDPEKMKQISPEFKSFLSRQGRGKPIRLNTLDAESRKGLSDLMKNINRLKPEDPLRMAAAKGEQSLLDAIQAGKGELTVEDTVVVPKFIPRPVNGVTVYPAVVNGRLDLKNLKPVSMPVLKELNSVYRPLKPAPVPALKMPQLQMLPKNSDVPELNKTGTHAFTAEFLTGFTKGHSWQWERRWSYTSGFFRVTIGGGYGFGLRVPVKVTGDLSPTSIYRYDTRDYRDDLQGRITAQTLDADEDYYRRTGLSPSKIFRGSEVVLEYQLGFGYKFRALWKDLAGKPFGGMGLNYSQDAKPPWGSNCTDCGFHIPIPPELTRTTFDYSVMTGFVQTGFHVNGTGKAFLKFIPYYSENPAAPVSMMFDSSGYQPFDLRLPRLALAEGQTQVSRGFGFKIGEPAYRLGLSITPEVRVGVSAGYKSFSRTFVTEWIGLNALELQMGTLQLPAHEGTRQDYTFSGGVKTFKKLIRPKFDPKKAKNMPQMITN